VIAIAVKETSLAAFLFIARQHDVGLYDPLLYFTASLSDCASLICGKIRQRSLG